MPGYELKYVIDALNHMIYDFQKKFIINFGDDINGKNRTLTFIKESTDKSNEFILSVIHYNTLILKCGIERVTHTDNGQFYYSLKYKEIPIGKLGDRDELFHDTITSRTDTTIINSCLKYLDCPFRVTKNKGMLGWKEKY